MNIALMGYGRMGQAIAPIAEQRGHQIVAIAHDAATRDTLLAAHPDVVIEFTQPDAAFDNLAFCVQNGLPVVSGTTGWLARRPELEALCQQHEGAFFYASNFSLGVNLFFRLNRQLAALMRPYPDYEVALEEIHHRGKVDAPSGTAITLAEGILAVHPRKQRWGLQAASDADTLAIRARREDHVPGTHTVTYTSAQDTLTIAHEAHNRTGFATGAVVAAEWLAGRRGVFGMDDLLAQ